MRNLYLHRLLMFVALAGCGGDDTEPYVVTLSTPEETPLALPLIPTHPTDGAATFTVTAEPQHGTLDGSFPTAVYTPELDFNGSDEIAVRIDDGDSTVELTLKIDVTPTNDPPVATADVVAGSEDTTQAIMTAALVANDRDSDGDPLTIIGVREVRFGSATLDGDHITFTPNANFNGSATLLYTLSDGHAAATGVLTISVGLVNDAPAAVDDYLATDEDTPLAIDPSQLTGNDTDPDEGQILTVTAVGNPQGGTATVSGGTVTFTPAANFNGDATFEYTVSDGMLAATALCTITVAPVNDAPVANNDTTTTTKNTAKVITAATLLANDSDVDGDTLTVTAVGSPTNGTVTRNGTNITFTPTANFTGAASFRYTISDGTVTATARVNITVN